jgi:uncharacterized membrane protein YhiD involved in acid resistance
LDLQVDLVLRLLVAGVLGTVVGLERESRGRDPGSRTHALVALGAALFTVAGAYGFSDVPRGANVDPARLAAQVATGIGFIGAGAIIRSGFSVRGLTTAATLWVSAALGVAAGAGAYVPAIAATALGVCNSRRAGTGEAASASPPWAPVHRSSSGVRARARHVRARSPRARERGLPSQHAAS